MTSFSGYVLLFGQVFPGEGVEGGGDATVITNRIETHKRVKKKNNKIKRYLLGKNTTCEFSG